MTPEQYLYVSYFSAAAAGVALAAGTAAILARPHRQATSPSAPTGPTGPKSRQSVLRQAGRVLRRALPAWLVLAVLLGFASVSYIDCGHGDYASVVADRTHLVHKTQQQASRMMLYLAVALTFYGLPLMLFLWAAARHTQGKPR